MHRGEERARREKPVIVHACVCRSYPILVFVIVIFCYTLLMLYLFNFPHVHVN